MFNVITTLVRNPVATGLALAGTAGAAYLLLKDEGETNLQKEMTRLRREGKLFTNPSEEELVRISEWKAEDGHGGDTPARTDDVYINDSSSYDNPALAEVIWPFGNPVKDIPGEVVDIRTAKVVTDDAFSDIPETLVNKMSEISEIERIFVADAYRMSFAHIGPEAAERIAIKTINQILGIEEPSPSPKDEPPVFELE